MSKTLKAGSRCAVLVLNLGRIPAEAGLLRRFLSVANSVEDNGVILITDDIKLIDVAGLEKKLVIVDRSRSDGVSFKWVDFQASL